MLFSCIIYNTGKYLLSLFYYYFLHQSISSLFSSIFYIWIKLQALFFSVLYLLSYICSKCHTDSASTQLHLCLANFIHPAKHWFPVRWVEQGRLGAGRSPKHHAGPQLRGRAGSQHCYHSSEREKGSWASVELLGSLAGEWELKPHCWSGPLQKYQRPHCSDALHTGTQTRVLRQDRMVRKGL